MKQNALFANTSCSQGKGATMCSRALYTAWTVMIAIWHTSGSFLVCILAILCLCAAGSDGDYFPWVNFGAAAVLVIIAIFHNRGARGRHRTPFYAD